MPAARLPLTTNGKIGRRALPAPAEPVVTAAHQPPRTDLERALVELWRDVLGAGRVGVHDSFFDLGGHSLALAAVHSRLGEVTTAEVPLVAMYEHPTIAALAGHLAGSHTGNGPREPTGRPPEAPPGRGGAGRPGGGGCMVMVTSRDQLDGLVARDGAQRLALDTLPADEAHSLLARTVGGARVQAEPEAVTTLVEACGRLPLALRIAAANLTARPTHRIADYVAQLRSSDRLALLRIAGDDQTAVAAAFDLSYDRLPEPARRMFRLLGLVPGPDITAEAAAAVVDETPAGARALLDTLGGAHLAEERHPGRFACHDLLRHYAAARARRQETIQARDVALARLFDHYLCTASAAVRVAYPLLVRLPPPPECASQSRGFTDADQAWSWLDAERANLVAVAVHAAEHGPHATAWRLADTLRAYFVLRSHLVDWETVAQAGLTALVGGADPLAHAAVHHSLAGLRQRQSRLDEAIGHASEALGHARGAGWTEGEAALLNTLGSAQWLHGDPHAARESFARAVELFEQAGWHLATVAADAGDAETAGAVGRQARSLLRDLGVPDTEVDLTLSRMAP